MRCINCGWNNPDGLQRCQKCNQPLPALPIVEKEPEISLPVKEVFHYKATQREVRATTLDDIQDGMRSTVLNVNPVLPESNESVQEETQNITKQGYKLVPIDGGDSIECVGSPFVVKQSLLSDSESDSECQAELTVSEGCLYVEDKSRLSSTYVLARRKMALERGDVILMGGKRFIIE